MPHRVMLYDESTAERIPWPDTADGRRAKAYLMPMLVHGTDKYIANAHTRFVIAVVDDDVLVPCTLNEAEYGNSYVCSPYSHYVRYAKEELSMLRMPLAEKLLSGLLGGIGALFRMSGFNRVVHVNNWLLSTNLYPSMTASQCIAICDRLRRAYPTHAVVFRSLNRTVNAELLESLVQDGGREVASRQIYLLNPSNPASTNAKARWLLKRDYELLEKHGYAVSAGADMPDSWVPRIVDLYNQLYLEKYSYENPQLTEAFIRAALREGTLTIYGIHAGGRLDAVLGYYRLNGVMTTPLFGYDVSLPQDRGLYRMLSALLIRLAHENGHLLHESSGAAQFKRNRGAQADMEYSTVFDKHLPWRRRWCWVLLEQLLNGVGVPLMRKLKL
jgi:hypothetical protein